MHSSHLRFDIRSLARQGLAATVAFTPRAGIGATRRLSVVRGVLLRTLVNPARTAIYTARAARTRRRKHRVLCGRTARSEGERQVLTLGDFSLSIHEVGSASRRRCPRRGLAVPT